MLISTCNSRHGFTLIQLSVMVVVLGLLAAAMIPAGGNVVEQTHVTAKNVAMIRQAMKVYMLRNGAIPCPALAYQQTSVAAYGVAASSGTACDTTNLLNSGNTFVGMVPVKTLALPDDVAFDGYGRRLTYAVDGRATTSAGCMERQALKQKGALDIRASAAGATESNAMWLLMSHGRDGHGAYPAAPGAAATVASRLNLGVGMTDVDTLTNANVNGAFAASVDAIFVNKAPTTSFDDAIWIEPQYANTCALGSAWKDGYYLTMEADANHDADTSRTAVGDINGDGYDDIVIGAPAADNNGRSNSGSVYIQFGSGGSFASPTALASTGTSPTRIRIDGAAASDAIGANVAIGDVNGDGKGDLIISSTADESIYLLFGRASWSSSTDISALVGGTMTDGFRFDGTAGDDIGTSLAVADVNRDGYGDIIAGAPGSGSGMGAVYVILGQSNASTVWTNLDVSGAITITALTATTHYLKHTHATATGAFGTALATGDVNGDGFADIVASSPVNQTAAAPTFATPTTVSGTGTQTLSLPTGTSVGDLLISIQTITRSDGAYEGLSMVPTGFTSPSTGNISAVGSVYSRMRLAYRVADGSEPASYTISSTSPTATVFATMLRIQNGTYSSAAGSFPSGAASTYSLSSFTNTPDSLIITAAAKVDVTSAFPSTPAGWTSLFNSNLTNTTHSIVYKTESSSGSISYSLDFGSLGVAGSRQLCTQYRIFGTGTPTYGDVYTIFGKASPTSLTTAELISSSTGFKLVGVEDFGSQVGEALAVGDINADGKDDIIIGAPNSTISSVSNAGIVHVVYGQAFGSASYDLDNVTGILDGTTGFYINGTVANQYIGKSLAVTDLNKDGYADIAITGGIDASNQIDTRIIWGKNTAVSAFEDDNAIGTLINGTSTTNGIILRRTLASLTANHITSGDLNGDRYGDLIIPFTSVTPERRSYVVFGRSSGYFPATTNIDNF